MINEELLEEIINQICENQRINLVTLCFLVISLCMYVLGKVIEYCVNKQNTRNEKKGEEELFISQKQYDMEIKIFLEFLKRKYSLECILDELIEKRGKLSRSQMDECEIKFKMMKKQYTELKEYLNRHICFVPLDIWNYLVAYYEDIELFLNELEIIIKKGLSQIVITENIDNLIKEVKRQSDIVTNQIRSYIYKKRVILT